MLRTLRGTYSSTTRGSGIRWLSGDLYYICVESPQVERLEKLVSREALHPVIESGGKFVFRNRG